MATGRVYTVQFDNVAVAAIQDLFELTPADDKPIEIIGLFISQTGIADVGDAQEEVLPIQIIRGFTTSGSAGSAPTPVPVKARDAAAGFASEVNNTTVATTGTTVTAHSDNFNVRVGYQNWWPENTEIDCSQTDTRVVIRLTRAPNDSITLSGTVYVKEYG
jgi:hypothetical protein